MEDIFKRIGKVDTLILYQRSVTREGKRIVAEAHTNKGIFFITDNAFKRDGERLKKGAKKIYYSKTDYVNACKNYLFNVIKSNNTYNNTNKFWVKCWECGKPIPPGEATWDGSGWYCGC